MLDRRTRCAFALAYLTAIPFGLLLAASAAVPFGPVLLGFILAFGGAVVFTVIFGILATDRYVTVGVAYAAGVATGVLIVGIFTSATDWDLARLLGTSGLTFFLVAFASLFGSLPVALVKWEDRRVRERSRLNDQ